MKKLTILLTVIMIITSLSACTVDAPHEHEFGEWSEVIPYTCKETGVAERVCECGEKEEMETPAAHRYVDNEVPATCISKGYTEHKCAGCGSNFVDGFTSLGEHEYNASVSITAPTYDTEGFTVYHCLCGRTKNEGTYPALKNDPSAFPIESAYIVIPQKSNKAITHSAEKLILGVKTITGTTLEMGTDSKYQYEILLGDTGRPESDALIATLGDGELAIKVDGKKLIIAARDELFLYEAVELLLESIIEPQKNDSGNPILIASSTDIAVNGNENSLYYTMMKGSGDLLFASSGAYTLTNSKYYHPGESYETHIYRRQGGTFNGKTVYQAHISANEELCVIVGKNIETGKTVYSQPMYMGHANDVTYNEITNRIYVPNGASIYVFDADTLEYIETVQSAVSGSGIHFSPERNVFLFKGGQGFSTASADLSTYIESVFSSKITGYTSQGIYADDTFIYFLLCDGIGGSKYTTHIAIYDWHGSFIRFMTVEIEGNHEPENISVIDGQIYIGACTPVPTFTQFKVELGSVQITDGNVGEIEAEEIVFDATAEPKKAYSHVNDYASDDADPRIHRRRAAFFDGTYFYQAYVNVAGDLGVIAKKNVKTDEVIYSEPRDIDHGRGIAYNPSANTITVSGKSKSLYVFNAETLEFIKEVQLPVTVNSISFNQKTGEYYCITAKELNILDSEYNVKSTTTISTPVGYTVHAITTDKEGDLYVLSIKSVGSERYTCAVSIYAPGESNYKKIISYELPDNVESPGISVVNGTIYVTGCTPVPEVTLYKLNIK